MDGIGNAWCLRNHVAAVAIEGEQGEVMIGWAVTFLVIALVAGVLGFSGAAGANVAWILFVLALVFAIVFFIAARDSEYY